MSKALLYNYSALVMEVPSPNTIIALVDHGFRSWSMRQFRLPGVAMPELRSYPRGEARDAARRTIDSYTAILASAISAHPKTCILVRPEKPSFSGHFSAQVYLPVKKPHDSYCTKFSGVTWLDVAKLMKDVCAGKLPEAAAKTFILDVEPVDFTP